MTTVKYDPEALCMSVKGHAGSAPAGEDLVCAAASILAWTLVDMVTETAEFYGHVKVREHGAEITVRAAPDDDCEERCRAVFETVACGFSLLAEKYPEYMRFEGDKKDGTE